MGEYANINYSGLTIKDRNPIKRALQNKRLEHGLRALKPLTGDYCARILDFGSGDGELSRRIAGLLPHSEIVCYEPSKNLRKQAEENVKGLRQIKVEGSLAHYSPAAFDYIFCLEVFEHLTAETTEEEFNRIKKLAQPGATIIIGVPNEIFLAALFKGILRLKRRYGEEDARIANILKAFAGFPPRERPVVQFDNMPYILRHLGFDHRKFKKQLQRHFLILRSYGSPNIYLPLFANLEIYFVCKLKRWG